MAQHALTAVCALPLVEGALRLPKRCCHHDVRPKHRLNSLPLRTCCAPQEGPIHDVQWNSKGDYFVVGERMLWVYNSLKVAVTWLASNVWPMRPRRSHPASPATTRWSRFQSTCVPLLHFVLAAVAGFMPAKTTLFTDKCVAKFDLGEPRLRRGMALLARCTLFPPPAFGVGQHMCGPTLSHLTASCARPTPLHSNPTLTLKCSSCSPQAPAPAPRQPCS